MIVMLKRPLILISIMTIVILSCASDDDFYRIDRPQQYVLDKADILKTGDENDLRIRCKRFHESTGIDMVILTLPTIENEDSVVYANFILAKWQVGGPKSVGLILLYIEDQEELRIQFAAGLNKKELFDRCMVILGRSMKPLVERGEFAQGFVEFLLEFEELVDEPAMGKLLK